MPIYNRKPDQVDAVQWTGTNYDAMSEFFQERGYNLQNINYTVDDANQQVNFNMDDAFVTLNVGDWFVFRRYAVTSGKMDTDTFANNFDTTPVGFIPPEPDPDENNNTNSTTDTDTDTTT